jgi:hypothetical protein
LLTSLVTNPLDVVKTRVGREGGRGGGREGGRERD